MELSSDDVSLSTAWMLRWLPEDGAPAGEVVATCGDNFKLNAWVDRSGILQIKSGIVTLTAKGRRQRAEQDQVTADVERLWERRYGSTVVGVLREAVSVIELQLEDRLPDYPMLSWVGGLRIVGVDC